ncbi:hypothetical protein SAMN03080618_02412 [Aquamicrobium aerolatum DSM 21857]|uniref:Anti-sigma factor NepR domain-containing protein n=2 Tax=Aerobium TaxID=3143707 RepID=A0A1I3PT14_9HYPH|nr:hypothetical protein SAMN03080618_02412 [Aquamicrobium aerolatum DSM 21857]
MSTRKEETMKQRQARDLIHQELTSETNRRFLNRMSAFKLERGLPDRLQDLLRQLDNAERKRWSS